MLITKHSLYEAPLAVQKYINAYILKKSISDADCAVPNVLPHSACACSCFEGKDAIFAAGDFGILRLNLRDGSRADFSALTGGKTPDLLFCAGGYLYACCADTLYKTLSPALYAPKPRLSEGAPRLKPFMQKEMYYYANGDARITAEMQAGFAASRDYSAFPYPELFAPGQLTCYLKSGSVYYIGTTDGVTRLAPEEVYAKDVLQQFESPRYLYDGDDCATGLCDDGQGGFYIQNAKGVTHVAFRKMSFPEKCLHYENTTALFDYRRAIIDGSLCMSDAGNGGDYKQGKQYSTNNDAFWTVLYLIGEAYRHAQLQKEGKSHEAAQVKADYKRYLEHIMLLSHVCMRGDGFLVRSYHMKNDEVFWDAETGTLKSGGLWFEYDEKRNCFVCLDTPQARSGGRIHEGGYLAYSLTQDVQKAQNTDSENPIGEDRDENITFRLTSQAGTPIPPRLLKLLTEPDALHPERYPGAPLSQLFYKSDSSSEEVIAAFTAYGYAHKYVLDPKNDADDKELYDLMTETAVQNMAHLIDNGYRLKDATGRATEWGKWNIDYFASFDKLEDEGGDTPFYSYCDAALNSVEFAMCLKVSIILTENDPRFAAEHARFLAEYERFFHSKPDFATNGLGYAQLFGEYKTRYLRQTAGMARSCMEISKSTKDEALKVGFLHASEVFTAALERGDHTLCINYSDEEMTLFAHLPFAELETDPQKLRFVREGFDQWYENMGKEYNALYDFTARVINPELANDLSDGLWNMTRMPLYLITFPSRASQRQDVLRVADPMEDVEWGIKANRKMSLINRVLPYDERRAHKYNTPPFNVDSSLTDEGDYAPHDYNNPGSAFVGSIFTTPYWMGKYYGFFAEE